MPFFLAVPPTDHIAENAEVRQAREKDAQTFRAGMRKVLGGSEKTNLEIKKGAFRGTDIFDWDAGYNGILLTTFIYSNRPGKSGEWLRLASLIRQSDCVLMGSTWAWRGDPPKGVPVELKQGGSLLQEAKMRVFGPQNSYRYETSFVGRFSGRGKVLLETIGGESMAAAGVPTVSSLGRNWCDATLSPEFKRNEKVEFPARAHRVLVGRWEEEKAKVVLDWPSVKGSFAVDAGTFGVRKAIVWEQQKFEPFAPVKIADGLVARIKPITHKITDTQFKIIKREGRWVYLDRGRAYGLEIGTHLVSRGATLHVIQYAPDAADFDVAIAMIRIEDPNAPLRDGDTVSFDLTQFPKK